LQSYKIDVDVLSSPGGLVCANKNKQADQKKKFNPSHHNPYSLRAFNTFIKEVFRTYLKNKIRVQGKARNGEKAESR
jgi:hypothetical protein